MSGAEAGPSRSYIDSAPPQLASPQISSRINLVTYGQSTIKALIDPSLPVQDVIRQLCANAHLGVQEPPALFALRDDDNDELVDDANMARKIEAGANFKLCSSPTIEAVEMVDKLSSRDDRVLKMATYTLQKLIREPPFTDEFIARGGVKELLNGISNHSSGNTLAYALTSCQNLMEGYDYGWEIIDATLVAKVVSLLVSQERINVCRPATAILKKLVVSGPDDSPKTGRVVTDGRNAATTSAPPVYRYGFEFVYDEIQREKLFLQTLVNRLGSSDTTLKLYSLSLINSLLRNVSDDLFDSFASELEKLNASKSVAWLMDSNRGDDLASSILEYQSNIIRAAHRRMRTTVTPTNKRHVHALSYIWLQAKISDVVVPTNPNTNNEPRSSTGATTRYKWRRIGFASESAAKEFGRTGWLGLSCLESFVRSDPDLYSKIILEQINRPEERRCMLARASIEVTSILADHWNIESGSYTTSTTYLPFLLAFPKVHNLALRFFLRMWNESGAAASDFPRVSALVRSQVEYALGKQEETSKTWFDLETAFLNSEYRTVRDRQMKELEVDEDYNSKSSIRNLRGRIYRESYEFVRQQRIQCLLTGAWFHNPSTPSAAALGNGNKQRRGSTSTVGTSHTALPAIAASANGASKSTKPWRFYRLAPNKKWLYYCDSSERFSIRGGLDDLSERIDLSLVTDVAHHGGAAEANGKASGGTKTSTGELVISLMQGPDVCLAEMQALNSSQFSEWTDGLNMLRGEGGMVSTRETADLIETLTEIGIKIKLLDLTGEQIELPTAVQPPPLPSTTEFFFAEL